MLTNRKLLIVD